MTDDQARHPRLTPDDQRLLDALVACGFDADALSLDDDQRQRAQAMLSLLGLLNDYPVEDADEDGALIDATMARIDRHERGAERRWRMDDRETGRRRLRLPSFMPVAAAILIAASVAIPVLSYVRARAVDLRCENNMRVMAYAFDSYAADFGGELPLVQAGIHRNWSRLAENFVNLAPLVDSGYCERGHLNCPGHGSDGPGYSYQWQPPDVRPAWGTGRAMLVLGDRNPVLDALRSGASVPAQTLSVSHGGRGQNVLSTNGSTFWLQRSEVGRGDNIWTPKAGLHEGLERFEPGDVFLVH